MLFLKVLMKSDQQRSDDTRERLNVTEVLEETTHVDQQNQERYLEKNVERSPFHDCHSFSDEWEIETRDDWNEGKSILGFIETGLDTILNFFIIKPNRWSNFTNLFWHETLHVSDSSSVHHQEFIHCTLIYGICHTDLYDIYHC
jgi:hypothetical protein